MNTATSEEVDVLRQRVSDLERDLTALKLQLATAQRAAVKQSSWELTAGAFAGDAGFAEMNQLGREWRESTRDDARPTDDATGAANGGT